MGLLDDILGGLAGEAPAAPDQVQLDPGTASLLNNQVAKAQAPASEYQGMLQRNTEGAQRVLGQSQQRAGQTAAGLAIPPGQLEAGRRLYSSYANKEINRLTEQNEMKGKLMKADYMNSVAKSLMAQRQAEVNYYQTLTDAYKQQEASRAQMIASIFQTGSTVAGMYAANRGGQPSAPAPAESSATASFQPSGMSRSDGYNTNYM